MRRQDRFPDTKIFKYHNQNPHNRITTDCVTRAISFALDIPYNDVVMEIAEFQCKTGFVIEEREDLLLKAHGFSMQPMLRHDDGTKYTLKEFIEEHHKGTYLVRMPHHLTVVKDGVNYDIWDCTRSSRKIGNYWRVK
jgi:hypothetical protein